MKALIAFSFLFAFALAASVSHAQWKLDGAQVTSGFMHEFEQDVIPDGNGGFIVVWLDGNSFSYRVHVQRVNALGVAQWAPGGVVLTTVSDQGAPRLVTDGAGGAIVTWQDFRNGNQDIYAQRVNGAGVPQWAAGGVGVCLNSGTQVSPKIVPVVGGGAIIAWNDDRHFTSDFYAQRINGSGVGQWGLDGIPIYTDFNFQDQLVMASDGGGGAILAWIDYASIDQRIFAQIVLSSGTIIYPTGLEVCAAPGYKFDLAIATDGTAGAIVAWGDTRGASDSHLYAQRITSSGVLWWEQDGMPISTVSSTADVDIVSDGANGVILSWSDFRNGFDYDIYAQRIHAQGLLYWTANGVPVCTLPYNQLESSIIPDGTGGAILSWMDQRTGTVYGDIYANRVNSAGATTWAFGGVSLCASVAHQRKPATVSDAANGAIVVWEDFRNGNSDLHAQRVEKRGYWGRPEPLAESAADVPGDQGGKVAVNWIASGLDYYDQQSVTHYSVWRATDVEPAPATMVSNADEIGPDFQGAAFRRELDAAGDEYYWEWVGNQAAIYSPRYSFAASTRSDSTSQGNADHFFQVLAHTWNNFVFWTSNVVSGRSLDNLAPSAPLLLTAQRVGADVQLRWNRPGAPDLRDYAIYRATASGVTPVTGNFLASAEDTVLVDAGAPAMALYYIVTAYDVHENESEPSNEANVGATTNVGNTPSITSLTVGQNHPNPFTASTEWNIGLPAASTVGIDVFDVTGRRVRTQTLPSRQAGWAQVAFDGRDDRGNSLASGVYFYRVTAAGQTVTRKMVITR